MFALSVELQENMRTRYHIALSRGVRRLLALSEQGGNPAGARRDIVDTLKGIVNKQLKVECP